MKYRSRQANGLRPARSRSPIGSSEGVFVHWTAGPTSQTPRQIQSFHMDSRGWSDIAYSWLVDVNGTIHEGRGWGAAGAHTAGWNSRSHAVCAILGPGSRPTDRQLAGITSVIREHEKRYGNGFVRPHNDVSSTACPGPDLTRWVADRGWEQGMSTATFFKLLAEAERIAAKRPLLRRGDRSLWVPRVKRWLGSRNVSCFYGSDLADRVRTFQRFMRYPQRGSKINGRLDRETWTWLTFGRLKAKRGF